MIVLEYPRGLKEAEAWKERLENMTVGHELFSSDITEPTLTKGKEKAEGIAAIDQYLSQYEQDMAQWNQDRCDMWFFD